VNYSQTYPLVVESLNDLVGVLSICEAHLGDDCGCRGNKPAELQVTADAAHHTLDVCCCGSRCEVAGHHDIRSASSASYADAASIRGRVSSCVVLSGLRRKSRGCVGGAVAVVAWERRSGGPTAIARCRAVRARDGCCALLE
jgi:hypothetical protein